MKAFKALAAASAVVFAMTMSGCEAWDASRRPQQPQPMNYDDLKTQAMRQPMDPARPAPAVTPGQHGKPAPEPEVKYVETVTGDATSPRKCYELYRRAIRDRDFEMCWTLASKPSKNAYESAAADLRIRILKSSTPQPQDLELLGVVGMTATDVAKVDGKMFMNASLQRQALRDPEVLDEITRTEFDHESISGDKAKVYLRTSAHQQPEAMNLVREGDFWRIDMGRPAPR